MLRMGHSIQAANPSTPEVGDRLRSVGSEVAHFARLHKCENHLQFLKEWEGAAGK